MRERHVRKRLLIMAALAAVLIAAGATAAAYGLTGHDRIPARPSGIPAAVPDSQVNLMELSPVPARPAPGFTLTDQDGQVIPLSAFRGKVVVLEFMDPHCTDICPIVSAEFTDAYRDLGRQADRVVFAAVNVNQYHHAVADVAAYSRAHQLTSFPAGISSPVLCPGCGPSGMTTASRFRRQARTPTSSTRRWSTLSIPAAGSVISPPRRPTTPRRAPPTCPRTRSPPGAGASPRSRGSWPPDHPTAASQ